MASARARSAFSASDATRRRESARGASPGGAPSPASLTFLTWNTLADGCNNFAFAVESDVAWSARLAFGAPAPDDDAPFLPPRESRVVILAALGALVAFMALLRPIGFDLAMLALLLALFFLVDRTHPVAKLAIAVAASFGVHWAFETLLSVPLPNAGIAFLRQFGL
jgi:hypothetical protein